MAIMTKSKLKILLLLAWIYIFFGFIGFILWASFVELEESISGTGFIISKGENISIASPISGKVAVVYKKLGDAVKKDEVLMQFDASLLQFSLQEKTYFLSGLISSNSSLKKALDAKNTQVKSINNLLLSNKKLLEENFISKSAITNIQSQLSFAESEAYEIQSRIERNYAMEKEIVEQISSIREQINLSKIFSPTDGIILSTSLTSAGINVNQGERILTIVPDDNEFLVNAQLPIVYADKLKLGMNVDIMLSSSSGNTSKTFSGVLDYFSPDKLIDQATKQPFIESRISFSVADLDELDFIKRGLPVTVIVNIGKRTLLSYIIRPLKDRIALGMK